MDDDYFTNNIQSNNILTNTSNSETNESSNNEILLRAVEEHMQNTSQYFNNPILSDIIIKINCKRFYAHKFILSKSSDVFYTMLINKHWVNNKVKSDDLLSQNSQETTESELEEITLVETEECAKVFEK